MRDPRLSELEFLAHLENKGTVVLSYFDQMASGQCYGLRPWEFKQMVVHLLLEGYLNGPAEFGGEVSFAHSLPAHLDDLTKDTVGKLLSGRPVGLQLNHKGRSRLWTLRGDLQSQRRLDPSGLFSKDAFGPDYEIAFSFLSDQGMVCLLMCDLDHFKPVNDTLGHSIGDEAIIRYHQVIKDHIEKFGTAYRWGGDEVLILLSGLDADRAEKIAEGIRAGVEATFLRMKVLAPLAPRPTVSIGGVVLPVRADREAAINAADKSLYVAKKEKGRNCLVLDRMK